MTAPNATGADRANDHPRQDHTETDAAILADPHGERQVFDALAIRAAKAGCTLHQLSRGYLLSRWSLARELPDLRAVSAMLSSMGERL